MNVLELVSRIEHGCVVKVVNLYDNNMVTFTCGAVNHLLELSGFVYFEVCSIGLEDNTIKIVCRQP